MAIAKAQVVRQRGSGGDRTAASMAVAAGDVLVAVGTSQDSNTNNLPIGSIIFNGSENFSYVGGYGGSGGSGQPCRVEIWYLANPTATTANVVADFSSGINETTLTVYRLSGADAADLINGFNGGSGNGFAPGLSVTTDVDDCFIIGAICSESEITGYGSGQTEDSNLDDQGFENTNVSSEAGGAAGAQAHSYNMNNGAPYAQMMVCINPLVAAGTDVNSERLATLTGKVATNDQRSATTKGKDNTNSERPATTKGKVADDDERSATLLGTDSANSERSAEITGTDTDDSERLVTLLGKTTANAERDATLLGQDQEADERLAKITGKDTEDSERSAIIDGTTGTNDQRSAVTLGKDSANSERDARIVGKQLANAERSATTLGIDSATEERSAKTTGKDTDADERLVRLTGIGIANDYRQATLLGKAQIAAEILAHLWGKDTIDDERLARLLGKDTAFSERGARIVGKVNRGRPTPLGSPGGISVLSSRPSATILPGRPTTTL